MLGKIFKAYDVRAVYPDPLNEDAAWRVGFATGSFLQEDANRTGGPVLVSRDMRPSSKSLCEALCHGLRASGVDVIDLGRCDTSFMYFAVNHLDALGGIQTTASHNPPEYNGFKISKRQAKPVGASTGLEQIEQQARALPEEAPNTNERKGGYEQRDLWAEYRQHVLRFFEKPERKLKVVIDACNAMAGDLVPKVFADLPQVEIIPLNFEITGEFAHEPNPLVAANMVPTQDAVREHGADLGVCFDGDADRCMITDETGEIIGCDHLTALLTEDYFAPRHPGSPIVYDLRSSKVVEQTVRRLGCNPVKSKVGHVWMKAALREQDSPFGGELSGHFYFRDNYFADSGAITFALVLTVLGRASQAMSERIGPYRKYPQSGELNFKVEDKAGVLESLKQRYGSDGEVDELDGVTIDCWSTRGYWFNVRPSNTEPLLRLNAEAKTQGELDSLLEGLTPTLGEPDMGH